jgi:hypothetical protein
VTNIITGWLKVEWDAQVNAEGVGVCPFCRVNRDYVLLMKRHQPSCILDHALRAVGLVTEEQREAAREEIIMKEAIDWRRASRKD